MQVAFRHNSDGDTRACNYCGVMFPNTAEFFTLDDNCRGGISGKCRACRNAYNREWRKKNRTERLAKLRADYAVRYGSTVRANVQRRKDLAPLRVRAQLLRRGMVERSQKLNIAFDAKILTVAYLMAWIQRTPTCPCCSRAIDYGFKGTGAPCDASPSIDQINPRGGYTLKNIALICWRCNNLKRDATADELQRIVDWMRSVQGDAFGDDIDHFSPLFACLREATP